MEPERRRRRPAVSCTLCRRRKIRCNRETPCSNCIRSKSGTCVYDTHPPQYSSQGPSHRHSNDLDVSRGPRDMHTLTSIGRRSTTSAASSPPSHVLGTLSEPSAVLSTVAGQSSLHDVESIKDRIQELEEQLSRATPTSNQSSAPTPTSSLETTISSMGGIYYVNYEKPSATQPMGIARSVVHKTRLFGQSHWINGCVLVLQGILELIEPFVGEGKSKAVTGLQKCKSLARVVKAQRAPPWPSPLTTDLPPKEVVDELVECYLRTTERLFRILHLPTFWKSYEALWESGAEADQTFLVQLKLVLAIAAITYDDKFSLRNSAARWVYEGQTWLSHPEFKSRLSIPTIQIYLLLLLAREINGIGGDLIWVSVGSLFRMAVYMGLHRDPSELPKRPLFASEMRRRLWNTILEVTIQSSLTSGGPPFISMDDFDTQPPGNFNDDQIMEDDPTPYPDDDFTQMSIALALRKTLPIRLAIARFLNHHSSHGTYKETLRLDADLRAAYKTLSNTLQNCRSTTGHSPSQFEIIFVDFLMRRSLSALHIPFFGPGLHDTTYAFSRKVAVDLALKLWCAAVPSSPESTSSDGNDFARMVYCGTGLYRTVAMYAALLVAVELKTQLQEEESLGPVTLRPDLLVVLEEAKTWSLRCIEAGETNIKGYLLVCLVAAHLDCLREGFGKEKCAEVLVKTAEEVEDWCLVVLEEAANRAQGEGTVVGLEQMNMDVLDEDWDFMMGNALFDGDTLEPPVSWLFQ